MYIYTYHFILLCKLCKFSLLFIYPCLDTKVLTSNKVDVDVDVDVAGIEKFRLLI